jgi:hypothetical protein
MPQAVRAQYQKNKPSYGDVYCSGMITNEGVPADTFLVTGEEAEYQITFQNGNYVYLNRGADAGVKEGDEFQIVRPVKNTQGNEWIRAQDWKTRELGTVWEDEGLVRVVKAEQKASVAKVENACAYMQRGDLALAFAKRPAPPLRSEEKFDRFAEESHHAMGELIVAKGFQMTLGTNDIGYVTMGSVAGVKTGDYVRLFRYPGKTAEVVHQPWRYAFRAEGFGHAPIGYIWSDVPREVLGEAIVLRATPKTATVLITYALREIYAGDYAELE